MRKKDWKTASTNKSLKSLLSDFIVDIDTKYSNKPNKIIEYWPKVIGEKLSPMTKVIAFENKTLTVLVKSSTLHSILCGQEKIRLLNLMQKQFSRETIRNIIFKIG